ncbi:MAG: T9SS type A sorting domain-containing protein, partial [Cyclobacteriaceae bacterium]|nr:T9SS type A sorting domain-containing protein [Cyclobacteriaceae bacterium]
LGGFHKFKKFGPSKLILPATFWNTPGNTELWISDGTTTGTIPIKTFGFVEELFANGGQVFFSGNDGTNGQELWRSDGTAAGTVLVKDAIVGIAGIAPKNFFSLGSTTSFFTSTDPNGNVSLWRTDGTSGGTSKIGNVDSYRAINNNIAFFTPSVEIAGQYFYQLWTSDGSEEGTQSIFQFDLGRVPVDLKPANGLVYFRLTNPAASTEEIWRSDGTPEGTFKITFDTPISNVQTAEMTYCNGNVIFPAANLVSNQELWKFASPLKSSQTISFAGIPTKTVGDPSFVVSATASSGLPVQLSSSDPLVASITGSTISILKQGITFIIARQPGDGMWQNAPIVYRKLTVIKKSNVITFSAIPTKSFGDAAFTLSASASSSLPVQFTSSDASIVNVSGVTATILKGGAVSLTATQAGNADFDTAIPVVQNIVIGKINQTITFGILPERNEKDPPVTLVALASSGLPITFSSSNPSVASVSGSTLTIGAPGTATISAKQTGNESYFPAPQVDRTITVNVVTGLEDPFSVGRVYPNPNPGQVYVEGISDLSSLVVRDQLGRLIPTTLERQDKGVYSFTLQAPPGLYFLSFQTAKGRLIEKLVKY